MMRAGWCGWLLLPGMLVAAQAVTITPADNGYLVKAESYEATVASDGFLTSLQIGGTEFFAAKPGNPRGAYLWLGKPAPMGAPKLEGDNVVTAGSDRDAVRYTFADDGITWGIQNLSKEKMLALIVFQHTLVAMRDEGGTYRKVPLTRSDTKTSWFNGTGKLSIDTGSRIWSWVDNQQVWELQLGPEESAEVKLSVGPATADEQRQSKEISSRVIEPPKDPTTPMWDLKALSQTPQTYPAEGFEEEGVKAIYYDSVPYEGKPTRVFAWLGFPDVPEGTKVPGMVLVHGGGGTAFADWVRMWTARGYAAISMDTCGCLPGGGHGKRPRSEFGGAPGWGGVDQIDNPLRDQWTYQAVAAIVLANTLLRAQSQVDPERIGLTGISWGGYLTSLTSGVDPRFKFVAPVYGCGFYAETVFKGRLDSMKKEQSERWLRWWDPSIYLTDARMPMLWVDGTNDFFYWLPAVQKSYRCAAGEQHLATRIRMPHGQSQGAAPEEIHVFADHLLKGGPPLTTITGQGRDGSNVWATFDCPVTLKTAELVYTKDLTNWPDRKWEALPATVAGNRVTADLPEGTTAWFINLTDVRDLVCSGEHELLVP